VPQTLPAPPIDSLDHITLPVGDLPLAEEFYAGLLGATVIERFDRETFLRHRPDRAHEVDAANTPLHLTLRFGDSADVQLFLQRGYARRTPVPHPHIAMAVDHDELDAFRARLAEARVPLDGPRRLGPPGHASLYFADPWGNTLELVTMGYSGAVLEGAPDVSVLGHEWLAL